MKQELLWLGLSLSLVACSDGASGRGDMKPYTDMDPSTAANGGATGSANADTLSDAGENGGDTSGNAGNGVDDDDAGDTGDEVPRDAGTTGGADPKDAGASGGVDIDSGSGDAGSSGATSGDNDSGTLPEPPALVDGCAGQKLRAAIPEKLNEKGPWPVGALTTTLGGVTTEVWYPAVIGSVGQKGKVTYALEDHLPASEQGKIPPARRPIQTCDCYRGLPLDTEAGPYPVIVFVHGTAGFRSTNMENATHWASRGFVVVASDHPGIQLKNMLDGIGGILGTGSADQAGDARRVLGALANPTGPVAFLKDHLDLTRVGAMGHSAGGNAVSNLTDVADVIIPYAGGAAITSGRVRSVMYVTGDKDAVVAPSTAGYDGTNKRPKRRVWIKDGGHLVGGSLCVIRDPTDPTKDIVALANEFQIGNLLIRPSFGNLFDGCNVTPDAIDGEFIPASRGVDILSYVSTGQFEETLHCSASATMELKKTQATYGADVSQYAETLP